MSDTWSWSRLNSYMQCPAQYRLRYVDNITSAPVAAFAAGALLHDALAEYTDACYAAGVGHDTTIAGEIGERLQTDDGYDLLVTFAQGHEFGWFDRPDGGSPTEREFKVALPDGYGYLTGRLDHVAWFSDTGTLVVTDYKTHHAAPSAPERAPLQLQTYGWAILQPDGPWYGLQPRRLVLALDYVRCNERHTWPVIPGDLSVAWLTRCIDRIRQETRWPARPGSGCQVCGYTALCPALACHAPDRLVADDPQGFADWCTVREVQVRDAKAALKAWCEENGPIFTERSVWDWHTSANAATRYTLKGRGKARLDSQKAATLAILAAEGITGDEAEHAASLLTDLTEFRKDRLHKCIPFADDPFGPSSGQTGLEVDLSPWLQEMTPERSFGWRERSTPEKRESEPEPDPTGTHAHATDGAEPVLALDAQQ